MFCNKAWHFWHNKLKYGLIHSQVLSDVLHICIAVLSIRLDGSSSYNVFLFKFNQYAFVFRFFFNIKQVLFACNIAAQV